MTYEVGQRVEVKLPFASSWVEGVIREDGGSGWWLVASSAWDGPTLCRELEMRPVASDAPHVFAVGQRVEAHSLTTIGEWHHATVESVEWGGRDFAWTVRYDDGATGSRVTSDLRPLVAEPEPSALPATIAGALRDISKNWRAKWEPLGNATCSHCGGPAYHGLHSATCLRATGCGPEPLPEPDRVEPVYAKGAFRSCSLAALADDPRPHETLWLATGRGIQVEHPLRDGAVALWRAKVSA